MKTLINIVFILLISVMVLCAVPAGPKQAHAEYQAVQTMADIFDYAGSIPGFPVNGQMIRDSEELFTCIDNGTDPAVCLNTFHSKPVGSQISTTTGIPSWFWDLIEAYI